MQAQQWGRQMSHRVFVFGTLKEGFPNFHINRGRRVPGEFVTAQAYPLYLVGERRSPWMLDEPGQGRKVHGQVFEVDDTALAAMDKLERVGAGDGYRRVCIELTGAPESAAVEAFAYVKDAAEFVPHAGSALGPLAQYTLEHAALYRPRDRA
jgi:gamma-glutamylaminecyclotransferase